MAKVLERVFDAKREVVKVAFEGTIRECVAYIHKHISSELGIDLIYGEKARKRVEDIFDDAWYEGNNARIQWAMDWQNRRYNGYRAFYFKCKDAGNFAFYEALDDECFVKYGATIWTEAELPQTIDQLGIRGGADNKVYYV